KKGQATDDALRSITGLTELETLFIWDSDQISDAGVKHLSGLNRLKTVHFGNAKVGDPSLEIFARLPNLTHLFLQGNSFSNAGLKHLAGMKQLRSLSIGLGKTKLITDAVLPHLAELTALENLDLQGYSISDDGIATLKNLKNLRFLYLDGGSASGEQSIT